MSSALLLATLCLFVLYVLFFFCWFSLPGGFVWLDDLRFLVYFLAFGGKIDNRTQPNSNFVGLTLDSFLCSAHSYMIDCYNFSQCLFDYYFYCISLFTIEFLTMILLQKLKTENMAGPKPGSSATNPKAGKYCSFNNVVVCVIVSYSLVLFVFTSSLLFTGQAGKRRRWRKRLVWVSLIRRMITLESGIPRCCFLLDFSVLHCKMTFCVG